MKEEYLIFGMIAGLIMVIIFAWKKMNSQHHQTDINSAKRSKTSLSTTPVENDKLVVIEDVSEDEIKKILQDFCNCYNEKVIQAILRLTPLSSKKFVVTFPYDMNFEIYGYFINYVNYPIGLDRTFKTVGWTTTKPDDTCITEKSVHKNVMLYVSDFDTEYDNVFMTTSDNIGFKLDFSWSGKNQLLDKPEKVYVKQPINISDLQTNHSVEFQ